MLSQILLYKNRILCFLIWSFFIVAMNVFHLTTVHSRFDNRVFNKQCVSLAKYFNVSLIVADGLGNENSNGVTVSDVGKPLGRISRMLLKSFSVFNFARKNQANIYHIHDPELLIPGFVYSLLGKTVVYDIHEDYVTSITRKHYLPQFLRRVMSVLVGGLEHILAINMKKVIAEKYYARRFPTAVTVLNYPDSRLLKEIYSFLPDSSLAIYTGNVTPDRGALNISVVAGNKRDMHFKLVGKCASRIFRDMDVDNKKNLEVVGLDRYVPFDEIQEVYRSGALAGLALFPHNKHYAEKELTKFYEYMAVGLPIVATNFPVWKSLIEGNGVGLCVPPGDTDAAVEALDWLRSNPEKACEMGKRGVALIKSEMNWDIEFRKLLNLYISLGAGPSAAN